MAILDSDSNADKHAEKDDDDMDVGANNLEATASVVSQRSLFYSRTSYIA